MSRPYLALAFVLGAAAACSGAADQALFTGGGSSGGSGASGTSGGTSGASGGTSGTSGTSGGASGTSGGTSGTSGSTSGSSGIIGDSGFAGDANGLLDAACGTRATAATRQPTYLYIALDGSGSMSEAAKWSSAQAALDQIIDDFKTQADPSLGVGLMVFSDNLDATQGVGPYPTSKDIGVAFVDTTQHDLLRGRIDATSPAFSTPTLAVLQGAYKLMEGLVVGPPLPQNGRKVVVLMTDGVPTDGSNAQCTAAAAAELAKGITTFTVGIGPFPSTDTQSYDPVFLGGLAQAGGAAPAGCNPSEVTDPSKLCFTQITPGSDPSKMKQAFVDALNKIRQTTASCDLGITGSIDPTNFNVILENGSGVEKIIPQGAANGWTFDTQPPTKVVLHGAACDELKLDPRVAASFLEGCPTVH